MFHCLKSEKKSEFNFFLKFPIFFLSQIFIEKYMEAKIEINKICWGGVGTNYRSEI